MVIWIPSFMLTALPKWQLGPKITLQHKRISPLPQNDTANMVRSSKIVISAEIILKLLVIYCKETWYMKIKRLYKIWFRETRYWKKVKKLVFADIRKKRFIKFRF